MLRFGMIFPSLSLSLSIYIYIYTVYIHLVIRQMLLCKATYK